MEAGTGIIGKDNVVDSTVDYLFQSKKTLFSEIEAINLLLRVVDLVNDTLHSKDIVHTNLNPSELFLRHRSVDDLCF